jgi:hypothetical protein
MTDNGITLIEAEITKGSNRTVTVRAMRTSRARIDAALNPTLRDASREISEAYELLSKGWGYSLLGMKRPSFGVRGGTLSQEAIDSIRKKIGKLHEWEFKTLPDWRNSVKAIEEHGMTLSEYGNRRDVHSARIMEWYIKGLNIYCELQGWGKQII